MPVTVVPTSLATVAIDTFMTEVSSVIRNWPAASVKRTSVAPLARPTTSRRRRRRQLRSRSGRLERSLLLVALRRRRRPARLRTVEKAAPVQEHIMHGSGPDERLVGERKVIGIEQKRSRLRAADAAVERDEFLEGTAFVEVRVVEAADHDVGDVLEAVRAEQVLRGVRREVRERILAVDPAVGEVAGPLGPERDRAVALRADEQPADVGMVAKRRQQPWMPRLDLLERQPAALFHQVDKTEVSGTENDHLSVRDVVLRALLLLPSRLRRRVSNGCALLVAACDSSDPPTRERPLDQLVEPVAVALLEGRD